MAGSGEQAERIVEERVRAALPAGARCYANVPIVAKTRATGPAHDAEADLVIVHPEHGVLVIETKAGEPRRETTGHWFIGDHPLPRSPFKQAEDAKHDLVGQIASRLASTRATSAPVTLSPFRSPTWRASVAAGRRSVPTRRATSCSTPRRASMPRTWRGHSTGPGHGGPATAREEPPSPSPRWTRSRTSFRPRSNCVGSSAGMSTRAVTAWSPPREPSGSSSTNSGGHAVSRSSVRPGAARAWSVSRRLGAWRRGHRTLFVCFNSPLASAIQHELDEDDEPADRRPEVATFHRLCELLGARAATLPPKPTGDLPQSWWDETLPTALDDAIDRLPDERYHAVIVDEGQDFKFEWLASLEFLLRDGGEDVLWVFHDPGQALFRDDVVAELGLPTLELFEDYRSPTPVAKLAARFYHGPSEPYPVMEGGRAPTVVEAAPGRETLEAVRRQLHRLIEDEGVRPWNIAVLSGRTASKSEVWRQRGFGNVELWNGAIDDEGKSLALPSEAVPDEPPDAAVVRFEIDPPVQGPRTAGGHPVRARRNG